MRSPGCEPRRSARLMNTPTDRSSGSTGLIILESWLGGSRRPLERPQRTRSKSSAFRSRTGDPRNRNSPALVDTISPGRRASSRTCLEAASAISSGVGDGATMLLRSRRIRSIFLLRSRVSSSRLGSICLLRSCVSSCRRKSSLSREALTRACHSSRLSLVVSAVARSCAQQPIERPAVRLTVAIKKRLCFMPSISLRCERAKVADFLDLPSRTTTRSTSRPFSAQGIDNLRAETNLTPVSADELCLLIELGLVELRDDGPALTDEGHRVLDQ